MSAPRKSRSKVLPTVHTSLPNRRSTTERTFPVQLAAPTIDPFAVDDKQYQTLAPLAKDTTTNGPATLEGSFFYDKRIPEIRLVAGIEVPSGSIMIWSEADTMYHLKLYSERLRQLEEEARMADAEAFIEIQKEVEHTLLLKRSLLMLK